MPETPPDVLLIQPPVHLKRSEMGAMQISPNLGLAYIASYLSSRGWRVRVIDAHALHLGLDEIQRTVRDARPKVVGISAMTYQILPAAMVAAALKEAVPETRIVLGGCHATAVPERSLEEFEGFDAVVAGEGEVTFEAFVRQVATDERGELPGLYLRGGDFRVSRESGATVRDLDTLPFPAFNLFPVEAYKPFYTRRRLVELPLSASRGCPFSCIFCSKVMGESPRFRSTEGLLEELACNIANHGLQQVIFTDENFTLNRPLVESFCEGLIRRGISKKVRFICESRVNVSEPTLRLMARAGFSHVTFGVESGDQEVLDKADKSIRLEESRRAVREAKSAGMVVDGNFILGLPHETEASIRRTIDFACSLPLDYASFFLLVPYPGTQVLEMARRGQGSLRLLSERWDDFGKQTGGALELRTVTRKRLEYLQFRGYLKFYGHPKRWVSVFRKVSVTTILAYLKMRLSALLRGGFE